ncbi:MAG: PQQ-binding-like beta-propeller repeat protein [Pseudomonadales bacterium]|nr:PQQ-binding-like beta-propeller repeat protein [Pseudomonadales bacterium]
MKLYRRALINRRQWLSLSIVSLLSLLTVSCINTDIGGCPADERHLERHDINFTNTDVHWGSWGYDTRNNHHALNESRITTENVNQLELKWAAPTSGSVSATPTVVGDNLYFPDWGPLTNLTWPGGKLFALDRWTGSTVWSQKINNYNNNRFNNISRSSPAISGDLILLGDFQNKVPMLTFSDWVFESVREALGLDGACGGFLYAINRFTGDLVWKTRIGTLEYDSLVQSPVIHNDKVYIGVSSNESIYVKDKDTPCCQFRGNVAAVDLHNGDILWRQYMTIDNGGALDQFSGASVWSGAPTVDPNRNSLYVGTGNNYHVPESYSTCVIAADGNQEAITTCGAPYTDNHFDSIVAMDLDTGAIKWSMSTVPFDTWTSACRLDVGFGLLGGDSFHCPDPEGPDADFAQPPMLYTIEVNGQPEDRLAAGTKAGVFYSINPDNGEIIWQRQVGPGGVIGGMEFGSATDGNRIYLQNSNFDHIPYVLEAGAHAGEEIVSGFWAALDATTGELLWQTPVPGYQAPLDGPIVHLAWGGGKGEGFFKWPLGPPTIANGVVFAGVSDLEGTMVAMDAATGEILWQYESGASVVASPSVVDGRLYWGSGYAYGTDGKQILSFGLAGDER